MRVLIIPHPRCPPIDHWCLAFQFSLVIRLCLGLPPRNGIERCLSFRSYYIDKVLSRCAQGRLPLIPLLLWTDGELVPQNDEIWPGCVVMWDNILCLFRAEGGYWSSVAYHVHKLIPRFGIWNRIYFSSEIIHNILPHHPLRALARAIISQMWSIFILNIIHRNNLFGPLGDRTLIYTVETSPNMIIINNY